MVAKEIDASDVAKTEWPTALQLKPASTKSIFIIDSRVTNYQTIVAQLGKGSAWYAIDPLQDGVEQLRLLLAEHKNIESLHIVSHGTTGEIWLGSTQLNADTLGAYKEALADIGSHLTPSGDILFYGCDVGAGSIGKYFLDQLALLTRGDVAASSNLTGSLSSGGDWLLEVKSGDVESAPYSPISYAGTLATLNGGEGNDTITGTKSADIINGKAGNDTINGGGGNDIIAGGQGADSLRGGDGDDRLYGYNVHEDYYSAPRTDGSVDTIYGEGGNDRILVSGSMLASGGDGDDFIYQYSGSLVLDWSIGINKSEVIGIWPTAYWDLAHVYLFDNERPIIQGGAGDDQIFINKGATVSCGDGNDILFVNGDTSNSDIISYNGDGGFDTFVASGETISDFSKISGFEKFIVTQVATIVFPDYLLAAGKILEVGVYARNGNARWINFDASAETNGSYLFKHGMFIGDGELDSAYRLNIKGGQRSDVLNGWILDDVLVGNSGDDTLVGSSGADILDGGTGNDFIDGGDETDTAVFSGPRSNYSITEITYNTFIVAGGCPELC